MADAAQIEAFWSECCQTRGVGGPAPATTYFGDSAEMQTELCSLVLRGVKRATASLARYYGPNADPLPKPGDFAIVVDGHGTPRCIIEITAVSSAAFSEVDAQFAADEGEGDGSLKYWTDEHLAFFDRQAAEENFQFSETDQVVLERFKLIWPLPQRPDG